MDATSELQSRVATKAFLRKLAEANTSPGYCEEGWQVKAVNAEDFILEGHGLRVRSSLSECCFPEGVRPVPDDILALHSPQALQNVSPGYYLVLGDVPLLRDNQNTIVRLYWNLRPTGAGQLISLITRGLCGVGVPYRLKVLNDPGLYTRCDAGVLYMLRSDYPRIVRLMEKVHLAITRELKGPVPAFTKQLAWGVGYAEEPTAGESFGRSRTRLMAEGLVESYASGHRDTEDYVAAIRARFEAKGLDLEQPFLERTLIKMEPAFLPQLHVGSAAILEVLPSNLPSDMGLSIADTIGSRLTAEAFWHEGECNWLSDAQEPGSTLAKGASIYAFLGPDLYSGTSGIALFLAEVSLACSAEEQEHGLSDTTRS